MSPFVPPRPKPHEGTLSLLGRAQLLAIWRARRARKSQERFA